MIEINHEYYASIEVAKLLKEAGFDWECRGYFDGTEFHPNGSVECTNYNSDTCKYLKVPTLEVAQRWLREVKGMDVIISVFGGSPDKIYIYEANTWTTWKKGVITDKEYIGDSYNTYEEAQEAGIKKALEIILDKGE